MTSQNTVLAACFALPKLGQAKTTSLIKYPSGSYLLVTWQASQNGVVACLEPLL
jgi:hypothetical protein